MKRPPLAAAYPLRTATLAAVALALSACATRTPALEEAAAGATPPTAAASGGANTGGAGTAPPTGRDLASGASASATGAAGRPGERSVYFEFDSSALSADGRALVQQHADFLSRTRQPVRLEGNADERGSREYNIALGQRRAETVRQALTLRGFPGDSVEAVSYGEERPACAEASETCFASNRRVDFVYPR